MPRTARECGVVTWIWSSSPTVWSANLMLSIAGKRLRMTSVLFPVRTSLPTVMADIFVLWAKGRILIFTQLRASEASVTLTTHSSASPTMNSTFEPANAWRRFGSAS